MLRSLKALFVSGSSLGRGRGREVERERGKEAASCDYVSRMGRGQVLGTGKGGQAGMGTEAQGRQGHSEQQH